MTNRPLSEEEKNAALRTKDKLELELGYQQYLKAQASLMLDQGLEQLFLKQMRDHQQKFKDADDAIVGATEAIKIIDDQVANGVEIREEQPYDETYPDNADGQNV